jgi:hypothetical protein
MDERRKDGDEAVEDEVRCSARLRKARSALNVVRLAQEVHPDILEAMVELLSSSSSFAGGASEAAPGISLRTYHWGDLKQRPEEWESVTTREEGRMISGGAFSPFLSFL